jgi:hypothetical protein
MNPEIKEKWIAALRSGEYKQGTAHLNNKGKFCCLGVLCDLAVKEGEVEVEVDTYDLRVYYDGCITLLPRSVVVWAGLPNNDPVVVGSKLSTFNDGGHSFDSLATMIQENL